MDDDSLESIDRILVANGEVPVYPVVALIRSLLVKKLASPKGIKMSSAYWIKQIRHKSSDNSR